MRFTVVRVRNTDPSVPACWVDYPLLLDEEPVCELQEEWDRIEGLPLHWDEQAERNGFKGESAA